MRPALALLCVLLLTACGSGSGVSDADLAALRELGHGPLYWAGRSFAGLPLAHARSGEAGEASFLYGDCNPRGGFLSEGGCAPPVQVLQRPFVPRDWSRAYACRRLPEIRGVPTARHDGLVLFTGRVVVKVYGRSPAEEREVANALRTLDGSRSLPEPPPGVLAAVERACSTP